MHGAAKLQLSALLETKGNTVAGEVTHSFFLGGARTDVDLQVVRDLDLWRGQEG